MISFNIANENNSHPWSNVMIRIMNDIATDKNKSRFDYNKVVELNDKIEKK